MKSGKRKNDSERFIKSAKYVKDEEGTEGRREYEEFVDKCRRTVIVKGMLADFNSNKQHPISTPLPYPQNYSKARYNLQLNS